MADLLEDELDRLFRSPLADWIGARDALAARLRKEGDKPGAASVKALRKPSPAAWALNQLHFEQPELLTRAQEESDAVRALHARDGVDPRALSVAHASQRASLHEVLEAAAKRSELAGLPHDAGARRKLLASLQAVLAGADERFGRLMRDLEPSGFDAIASVGSAGGMAPSPRVATVAPGPVTGSPPPAKVSARLAEARAALREQELRAHDAHKRVQERRAELARAQAERAGVAARVQEAERVLADLRDRLARRAAEQAQVEELLTQAEHDDRAERDALAARREELANEEREPAT